MDYIHPALAIPLIIILWTTVAVIKIRETRAAHKRRSTYIPVK